MGGDDGTVVRSCGMGDVITVPNGANDDGVSGSRVRTIGFWGLIRGREDILVRWL